MSDDDHRRVLLFEVLDDFEHFSGQFGIERARRLVKAEYVRFERERTRDRDALLLSARQFARIVVHLVGKPHPCEQLRRFGVFLRAQLVFEQLEFGAQLVPKFERIFVQPPREKAYPQLTSFRRQERGVFLFCFAALFAVVAALQTRRERDVFERVVVGKEVERLENQPEMQPLGAQIRFFVAYLCGRVEQRLAAHRDRPALGRFEEVETAQQRRLAAAGRADDRQNLALVQLERHAFEHLSFAKALAQVFDDEQRLAIAFESLFVVHITPCSRRVFSPPHGRVSSICR